MSRSYKKVAGWCDSNPFMKARANRRIRQLSVDEELPSGCTYKRHSQQYDICDFKSLYYGGYNEFRYYEMTPRWIWQDTETDEEVVKRSWIRARIK